MKIILEMEEKIQMPAIKEGNKLLILTCKNQETLRIIFIKIENISNFYARRIAQMKAKSPWNETAIKKNFINIPITKKAKQTFILIHVAHRFGDM